MDDGRGAFSSHFRMAVRAAGVSVVFAFSALAGFGTDPTATRPYSVASDFAPRPFAMGYAVREAVAEARSQRQFAGVIAALDASKAAQDPPDIPVTAYGESASLDALDRFDAFMAGTISAPPSAAVPTPTMRPVGPTGDSP